MNKTPKEVAIQEVSKLIVTKETAKEISSQWISRCLNTMTFTPDVKQFWEQVLIEIENI